LPLSGLAASQIRRRLIEAGANVVASPESFRVRSRPELRYGELERAPSWARRVAEACRAAGSRQAVASA
jgi:hypothetical protein